MSSEEYITTLVALRRLVAKWLETVERQPDSALHLPLRDVLSEENIQAVRTLNLYSEYDRPNHQQALALAGWNESRARIMLKAWMAPKQGGLQ